MTLFANILGWAGAIAVILAYFLVSTGRFSADSPTFQGLNLIGAGFLGLNALHYRSWPLVALNVAWAGIAAFAILGAWRTT